MIKKYRVGIAGYGIVGKRRLKCIKKISQFDLIAVCDRNKLENKGLNKNIKFFSNYKDLLKEDLDIIFVCMTNDIAPIVTLDALKLDLHVFCEKPPGRTLNDIKKIFFILYIKKKKK